MKLWRPPLYFILEPRDDGEVRWLVGVSDGVNWKPLGEARRVVRQHAGPRLGALVTWEPFLPGEPTPMARPCASLQEAAEKLRAHPERWK